MSELIERMDNKAPSIKIVPDPFEALVRAVIHQNVRAEQSTVKLKKLTELFGGTFPHPGEILTIGASKLQGIGITRNQVKAIFRIASSVMDNEIDFTNISGLNDSEIIDKLRELPGIGLWSAQMFLVFHLMRPDVLMTGDSSLAKAVKTIYGLDHVPSGSEMETIFEKFRPYRSAAAWYIWRVVGDFMPGLH
jgi:DNA-3-methyladenine glycosylase II